MHETESRVDATATSIRAVQNSDSAAIIELIARCFADYPNCILDVDREEPQLRSPADSFERMWVAEDLAGRVVGMVGLATDATNADAPVVELKKLYIAHEARGTGLCRRLVALVEQYAVQVGARRIELWSDTRFDKAHRVYAHLGYEMATAIRDLHDLSNTREYHFAKLLPRSGRT